MTSAVAEYALTNRVYRWVLVAALGLALAAFAAAAQEKPADREPAGTTPPAADAASEAGDAAEQPPVPPALAPLANHDGRVSWRGIAPGMSRRAIASMLGVALFTDRPVETGCGGEGLDLVVDGVWVLMAFNGSDRTAELHTLLIRVDEDSGREALIAALKRQVGELRYLGRDEAADARPAFAAGDPEVVLMVEPNRGIRLTLPQCLG